MQRFSRKDAALVAKLPFSAALASALPETRWDQVTDAIIRASALVDRSAVERAAALILRHVDPAELDEPVEAIARRYLRNIRIDGLATLKSHDPRRWRAATRVEGLERIGAAQAAGRGVILWVAPFVFAALATKRALHEAGVPLHHLSTSTHGSSSRSRFGIRYISSIRVKAENRYLAERVVIPPGGSMHQRESNLVRPIKRGLVEPFSCFQSYPICDKCHRQEPFSIYYNEAASGIRRKDILQSLNEFSVPDSKKCTRIWNMILSRYLANLPGSEEWHSASSYSCSAASSASWSLQSAAAWCA